MPADSPAAEPDRSSASGNDSETGVDDRILAVLRSFARSSWAIGRHPGDQLDAAAKAFFSRIVRRSIADPRPVHDVDELRAALQARSAMPFAGAPAAIAARTVLTRVGPLKLLARRTPWLMAAGLAPGAYAAIARGRHELAIVASYLVHRSQQAGDHTIDPERLRHVAVQLLLRRTVDPTAEPGDADLVSSWIRRAVLSVLPFAQGGTTRHARSIAAAAARVDVSLVRPLVAWLPAS
ncbi:MAG: hypothetical protein ABIR32_12255 [Ilumatobacteraceae bacterium]